MALSEQDMKELRVEIIRLLEATDQPTGAVDEIIQTLVDRNVISLDRQESLPLLSAAGRVLVVLAENPDITLREAAIRLGITESNAQRAMSNLVRRGLIRRIKVMRRNKYEVMHYDLFNHPDVRQFLAAMTNVISYEDKKHSNDEES